MTKSVKLVGIDLSTNPRDCGICILEGDTVAHVSRGTAAFEHPDWLVSHCSGSEVVAVDVPFGWPELFVAALADYEVGAALDRDRKRYRYRATDVWITKNLPQELSRSVRPPIPLSVSTDKLGATAMVGTILLAALADEFLLSPRKGGEPRSVIEVYPAVSLWAWGLPHRNLDTSAILETLRAAFHLTILEENRYKLLASRHCLDALMAALTAREYADRNTFDPPQHVPDDTLKVEGWIRVPRRAI